MTRALESVREQVNRAPAVPVVRVFGARGRRTRTASHHRRHKLTSASHTATGLHCAPKIPPKKLQLLATIGSNPLTKKTQPIDSANSPEAQKTSPTNQLKTLQRKKKGKIFIGLVLRSSSVHPTDLPVPSTSKFCAHTPDPARTKCK